MRTWTEPVASPHSALMKSLLELVWPICLEARTKACSMTSPSRSWVTAIRGMEAPGIALWKGEIQRKGLQRVVQRGRALKVAGLRGGSQDGSGADQGADGNHECGGIDGLDEVIVEASGEGAAIVV